MRASVPTLVFSFLSAAALSAAQDGYTGYSLATEGDNSTSYTTANTDTSNGTSSSDPLPDVFLNASVHVGEIDIEVDNITAKVNLDAKVLSLLEFNAGVDVSIDRVKLLIQNVSAEVLLEARLENLVVMIADVLDSIDLNPVIAELASGVSDIVDDLGDTLSGDDSSSSSSNSSSSSLLKRSLEIEKNILYSVNDYTGNAHTNRMLSQNGSIVDRKLHNDGSVYGSSVVGSYLKDMSFTGHNISTTYKGQQVQELEYLYTPFPGLMVFSAIYMSSAGKVVGAQVLSESGGGGSSTIYEEDEF